MIKTDKTKNNLYRRQLLKVALSFASVSLITARVQAADSFVLVSDDEFAMAQDKASSMNSPIQIVQKNAYPKIVVESPTLGNEVLSSPLDIFVRFEASEGASIQMDSLKITYGFFMDVTKRILKNAELGDNFVRAMGAELPKGKHSFTIAIKDSYGNSAEQKIKVVVA